MTLEQFETKLKALLREAEDAGLAVDDFCELAEYVLAQGWDNE